MLKIAKVWLCRGLLAFSTLQIAVTLLYVFLPNVTLVFRDKESSLGSLRSMASAEEVQPTKSSIQFIPYNLSADAYHGRDKPHRCPERSWDVPNGRFILEDDNRTYFNRIGSSICAIHGSIITNDSSTKETGCKCKMGWSGDFCSVPNSVNKSNLPGRFRLKPRLKNPRRIIQAFPFNMEFAMLEARLEEFGDLVDVFLILESNYTAYGDPKDVRLLRKLREGYYRNYSCKMVHVFLDYFPDEGYQNGWIEDNLLRNYIVTHGLARQLSGYRHDDIFILTDADEIPKRETILFLKLHDGYPEPFGFNYQWNVYGFYWKANEQGITHVYAGLTVGMLLHVFYQKAISIRGAQNFLQNEGMNELSWYLKHGRNVSVYYWSFGDENQPAGWHCSWCCEPECIQTKLVSAQNGDFPRWGDFPEKRKLNYIRSLIQHGMWFDNVSQMLKVDYSNVTDVPKYFLRNKRKFHHLLFNPYESTSTTTET